jgi:predicted esterase
MKRLMIVSLALLFLLQAQAQQTPEKYVFEIRYLLSLPDGYGTDTTKSWPLVLFLHGSGESGADLEKVKKHGLPKLVEAGKKFPFIVISPQSNGNGWDPELLYNLLTDIKQKYRVDNNRVYLTGLSMGGFGTWSLALKHPETFAAIVPICGGGDTTSIWKLRYTPVWCFHGAKDNVVPLAFSQKMINALRPYNPGIQFTVYEEAMHDSWTATYNNDSLYTWLLSQQKHQYQQVGISNQLLTSYAGTYVNGSNDTVRITTGNGELAVKAGRQLFSAKPASNTIFFWQKDQPGDLEFVPGGFILRSNEMSRFRRL